MTISADALIDFFSEYRILAQNGKKLFVDMLLEIENTVDAQRNLLTHALQYDVLNPEADGQGNFLRRSEISVALFKQVFKRLPPEINRQAYLSDIFSAMSSRAKIALTRRQYVTKTGESITKTVAPFTLFYNLFLTMVFFNVAELPEIDFNHYSYLLLEVQYLKKNLSNDDGNKMHLNFKLHNAVTLQEKIKLDFLQKNYGLSIDAIAEACRNLYAKPPLLIAHEKNTIVPCKATEADLIQFKVLLELNKLACLQENHFGHLRFYESKPTMLGDEVKMDTVMRYAHQDLEDCLAKSMGASSSSSVSSDEDFFSFWKTKVGQIGAVFSRGAEGLAEDIHDYYLFQRH